MRLLQRLGNDVALGHTKIFPLITGVWDSGHHAQTFARGLFPRLLLLLVHRVKAAYFSGRGPFTRAELDAAARHQIEGGDAFCYPRWMVLLGRHLHDAVPQPNILGARCRRGQEHFGGRRMAVLFEEVVLGDEDVVIPELIGELDLLQRFMVYLEFVLLVPLVGVERFGRLQLEINAEFHALLSLLKAHVSTRAQVA
jgi:hypothetical protein